MSQVLRLWAAIAAGVLLVALVALLASGCASSGPWVDTNAERWPKGEVLQLEPGITLALPRPVLAGTAEADRIAAAARAHLAAFRADWPQARLVAPVELGVTLDVLIPCGSDRRERYHGCWCFTSYADGSSRSTLLVVAGEHDELPALYHELVHHALLGDGEHRDPRWPVIDRRGEEVAERIRVERE